ncbi:MAG: RagB/SusD family nutrient uptake outer membrane protein [Muribaculaceae bacterium]|nr:RagB/SusD family nutrient uptake outer membrane protein [Muribaculaceae bacterium]
MKKLYFSILAASSLFASCDMNQLPVGSLNDETAIIDKLDALKYRNGIYYTVRDITNSDYLYDMEIQADMFVGTQINDNRLGVISSGNIYSSDQDLEGLWADPYFYIAAVNYFLPNVERLIANEEYSETDRIELRRYRGEAKWARAYYYYYLIDHFSPAYALCNPDDELTGVPIVLEYSPSDRYETYPGRSSLNEVYKVIDKDLEDAYIDIEAYEKSGIKNATENLAPNAAYLSTNTVLALQARLALLREDYETAISKAEAVIGSGKYSLTGTTNYPLIWTKDQGSEIIFRPYGDLAQSAAIQSMGSAWISANLDKADYVATSNALEMYDDDDIRLEWFFEPRALTVNGQSVVAPCFVKYPGNTSLNTGQTNDLKNLPKPFRLSEMYLIVAEAAAMSSQNDKANSALNAIRKARIDGYATENYGGQTLINEVRKERARELIGEGFRISDLRRWNLGFARETSYTELEYEDVTSILVPASMSVSYPAGDHRFILPIPTAEIQANPQIANQQNPGY